MDRVASWQPMATKPTTPQPGRKGRTVANLGYARVSTSHQTLDQQIDKLVEAGVKPDRIYQDKITGTSESRPGLDELLKYARDGDTLTVVALDRLGRSVMHVLRTMAELEERGIALKSLREGVDFSTPVGKMIAGIFTHLAEYEHSLINERAAAARAAARARGKPLGRKKVMDADKLEHALILRAAGQTVAEICQKLGVGRSTLYRAFEQADDPE